MADGVIEIRDKPAAGQTIRLHDTDNVLIARTEIGIGAKLEGGLTSRSQMPAGHKIAARAIRQGEPILKYNVTIGFAAADIPARHATCTRTTWSSASSTATTLTRGTTSPSR